MSSDDDASTNRRTVLQAIGTGATLVATSSLAGVAAGETTGARPTDALFRDDDRARATLSAYGGETLRELSAEGHLPEASADLFLGRGSDAPSTDRIHVRADGRTTDVTATRTFDDRTVHLVVRPEIDRSFAVVDPEGGERFVVDARGDVGTEGYCWWESNCTDDCLGGACPSAVFERECCDQGGQTDCTSWSRTTDCCGGTCD